MWKYSNQITIRWAYFILLALALAVTMWLASGTNPEILTQPGLKAALTEISVRAEFQPLWVWPGLFFAVTILMLTGVPSILPFAFMMVVSGFYTAFIVTFLSQVFVTRICIHRAWKIADRDSYQKSLQPALKSLLWQSQEHFMQFAFWSRVYFAYPLRTVDYITPMIQPGEKQLSSTLLPAAAAIFLRMLIPSFWLHSLIRLAVNVAPDPAGDASVFLLWSSALVAYTMIPRVPEFFVCSDSVRPILTAIGRPAKVMQNSADAKTAKPGNSDTKSPQVEVRSMRETAQTAVEG
ncbi:MAG: hypothetical protein CVV42_17590 [Candidatus Riflebacteria bacterium HGW-Riflebacteria-2]|jgi:hypothetical protein|nr:MAG: hypothetical protein CVV42_17590 [Candidatus Riflebacteria bacterium HGW-Riflebacteria-2]